MKPLISILTPTFNHQKYIQTCIQSVVDQTYPHWEMIIIDDGSTDDTAEIVRRYSDPRIAYIRKEHRGIKYLGENYNQALEMSKGEYILILEGDDFLPPNRIDLQLPSFDDEKVVLSHGRYVYIYNKNTVTYPTLFKNDVLTNNPVGSAFKLFLQGFNPIGTQSVMVRKSTLVETGGFIQPNYLPLVDYPTWMRLALKGTFAYIPEVLGFWRRHPVSVTMNQNEEIFFGFIRYCDEFIRNFQTELNQLGLREFMKKRGAIAYLSLAWIQLSNQNWGKARELSKEAWKRREVVSCSFKMKVIGGLVGSYLHKDIPGRLKRMRRWLYQKPHSP